MKTKEDNLNAVCEALKALADSEVPVTIEAGLELLSMREWRHFLKEQCNFIEDTRHFDFSGDLKTSDWWDITYEPSKDTSYAYSNTRQPMHTDNAWFQDPAEINFFVMQKQASVGGSQTILPLSRLLESLSRDAPELLKDLSSIPVVIKKGENSFENHTTIIAGESKIYWNFYRTIRSSPEIDTMCNHFFDYLERLEETNIVQRLHCNSGDCFAFNDTKLLHGREAFNAKKAGDRLLSQSMWRLQ